jgi:peptidoglycan/LPS O-acetylase OafA/YrhL
VNTPNQPLPAHLPSLDGIRGIAIGLVFIHTTNILHSRDNPLAYVLTGIASMGWVGVQLFFVLSGFLITRNLLQIHGVSNYFSAFYGRRALRILPLYYVTLLFFFGLLPLTGHAPEAIQADAPHQLWFWTFLSNWTEWLGFGGLQSLPHFWSLAVEEQFYLLWPLVVLRCRRPQLIYTCLAIGFLSMVIRCYLVSQAVSPIQIYTSSLCRMDALAMGAALAAYLSKDVEIENLRKKRQLFLFLIAGLVLVGKLLPDGLDMQSPIGQTLGYTLLAGMFTLMLLLALLAEMGQTGVLHRLLCNKTLRIMGKYSFAMYLFHVPLHTYVGLPVLHELAWVEQPSTMNAVFYMITLGVATYVLAQLAYLLLEGHFLALKRHFVASD